MEKINTEILISSLLKAGYDKIDPLLFTFILNKITEENEKSKKFKFVDEEYSEVFNKYVDHSEPIIKLKEGAVISELNTNVELIEMIETINIRNVALEKMKMLYKLEKINQFKDFFSTKEEQALYNEFDIEMIPKSRNKIKTK